MHDLPRTALTTRRATAPLFAALVRTGAPTGTAEVWRTTPARPTLVALTGVGDMAIRVQVYTADAVFSGTVARIGPLRDALEIDERVTIERTTIMPLDGGPQRPAGEVALAIDDALIAVGDDDALGPVHAVWHSVRLEAGPYLVEGELPTLPGFDPGRALTRATGTYVLLRDVAIRLAANPDGGEARHGKAFVNRYGVDRVSADLMLGFLFPGAEFPPVSTAAPTA